MTPKTIDYTSLDAAVLVPANNNPAHAISLFDCMDASPLSGWENFYVIVGSSAGALIGLQFVVITLIADLPIGRGAEQGAEAFATPTIVHFGTVLLLSAILNAPWFLWSQQHRCCCSSSASTTPGTQSLTTSSCKNESSRKESASAR